MAEPSTMKTSILAVDVRKIGRLEAIANTNDLLDDFEIELDDTTPDARNLKKAACQLRSSSTAVAFPTETVYGLGGDATRSESVQSIFRAKARPADNPLIVHFASLKLLRDILSVGRQQNSVVKSDSDHDPIPAIYHSLIRKFWPGPLTIILPNPAQSPLATEVTAGLSTFGARMPGHILALALINLANVPIAAPSANASTKPSPTAAEHVMYDLNGRIETIIDGGPCDVGVESTVVDGLSDPPLILRPGGISIEQLRECPGWSNVQIGYKNVAENGSKPVAPGMKYRHYSPKANVILLEAGSGPPSMSELEQYAGSQSRLGLIRTKRWHLDIKDEVTPISLAPLQPHVSGTNFGHDETHHQGFARLLATLQSVKEPRKALRKYELLTGSSTLSLFDISLGPSTPDIARGIFAALRELDSQGVHSIIVEGIYDGEGDCAAAIMNRLRKASEIKIASCEQGQKG
ncbi:hypothetical protein M433DRAFT_154280 [Acidomyces richmondensis BFW]|nr:MAG: hypothetical protein FE78DRAFT_90316 [Acidomyces sp. 'richmondensis']KYG45649.1 hypothetical protein M433DRAFT_154280 [Acidomyces richmondensis BFW]